MGKKPLLDSKDFDKALSALSKHVHGNLKEAMDPAHDRIADKAVEYAPLDTGALEKSMRKQQKYISEGVRSDIQFGGGVVDYAYTQHEFFPVKKKKGRMKYLEDALMEDTQGTLRLLADGIKRVLRKFKGAKNG